MFASRINVKPRHKQPSNFDQFRSDYDRLVMFGANKVMLERSTGDSKMSGAWLSSAAARPKSNLVWGQPLLRCCALLCFLAEL